MYNNLFTVDKVKRQNYTGDLLSFNVCTERQHRLEYTDNVSSPERSGLRNTSLCRC